MQIKRREYTAIDASLSDLSPLLQRIFAARGVTERTRLDTRLQALHPFELLTDIGKSAHRLCEAIQQNQRILIIGDFDADGATSSALAVTALRAMGAKQVDFLVPNRFEFGYGLTPGIVGIAAQQQPNVIVTVDNGISSFEGVLAANALGIDVVITDHHLPSDGLPEAYAIVNPNQPGDLFPSKSIAGVGVIFYVMLALRHRLRECHWFEEQGITLPNMAHYLDLVALGTVADVVALDHNNRVLVSQGLMRIRGGLCRPGILALASVAGREPSRLRETDMGFAIAPRLNAAGRLDDMSLGIECLLAKTMDEALDYAKALDELNQSRRSIEAEMSEQALLALNRVHVSSQDLTPERMPRALCLMDESWHQGVIGILAGRLKERYHRPTIVFAPGAPHELKGSARSVSNVNIRDILAAIDSNHPGLITKFGGHAMAAGLSLPTAHFKAFREAFVAEVSLHLEESACCGEVLSDGPLEPQELILELAHALNAAGPWGQQFAEPLFDNVFEILDQRIVGQHHLKLSLKHPEHHEVLDAIAFNIDKALWPNHRARQLHVAYRLDINHYRGRQSLQLMIHAMQAADK